MNVQYISLHRVDAYYAPLLTRWMECHTQIFTAWAIIKHHKFSCDGCLVIMWSSNCHMTCKVVCWAHCKSFIKLGSGSAKTARIHLSKTRAVGIIHFQGGEFWNSFGNWFFGQFSDLSERIVSCMQRKCKCHWFSVGIPVASLVKTYRNVFKRDLHSLGTRHRLIKYEFLTCWWYGVTWYRCSLFSSWKNTFSSYLHQNI